MRPQVFREAFFSRNVHYRQAMDRTNTTDECIYLSLFPNGLWWGCEGLRQSLIHFRNESLNRTEPPSMSSSLCK